MLVAVPGVFRESFGENFLDLRWLRVERPWGVVDDGVHRLNLRFAPERTLPGEHFIQHHSEREYVGAVIERLCAGLFGRHVGHGTHHPPGFSQCRFQRLRFAIWAGNTLDQFC
jgi:hypothetical protein